MARRYCAQPGCTVIVDRGRCARHAQQKEQERPLFDVRRWYRTKRWKELRAQVLAEEPYCADRCGARSTEADHEVPHRGDEALFWDRRNLRGRCHPCHSRKTQRGL